LTDLRDRADIVVLVTEFYRRAFSDPVLGPIFTDVARMDLTAHLPVMCDFWETVLLQAGLYRGNAFNVHATLHRQEPLTPMHFQRWLEIWQTTVADLFAGPIATAAAVQARRIAGGISRRLEQISADEALKIGSPLDGQNHGAGRG
jgi:hemoglobin